MNKEALENFRIAGLLQPEYLGEGGTLPVTINGSSEMVNVIHQWTYSETEVLYMPVEKIIYSNVLSSEILSTMGAE